MKQPTRSIIVMCAAALAGGTGGAVIATETSGPGGTQTVTRTAEASLNRTVAATSDEALSASAIYARSKDSVAFITATSTGASGAAAAAGGAVDPYGRGASPYGEQGQDGAASAGTATGSGFVISADGYVVTNAHVIDGASRVTAKIGDGKALSAKVVGVDASTDLALLKVTPTATLRPLTLADSGAVQVGDAMFAIGNPYGLDRTLTTGVVSALHRSIQSPDGYAINGVLQTDAALNPGNSGGPLLDARGHVVGVNSQIATSSSSDGTSGGNTGVGFAVPSDTVTRVVQQLRDTGKATHAYLGVGTSDGTGGDGTGAKLASVTASGPAADAGLRAGDVITKIGDTPVDDVEAMGTAVDAHRPGERVAVTYTRDGRTATAQVTLGTRPAGTTQAAAATAP
ncbi:S1C family serine protease [Patulibacter americanus]|uniref:S1C family serine protease n=1 Tax=Patulibacter americanus TaxID=588672 RepID=UPI0003B5DC35|nr:trypsin-like peptidase domain-containing protein [Patulibacter americanus]